MADKHQARHAETPSKFVWLLERTDTPAATYWTGNDAEPQTTNPWDACWFGRVQDATRIGLLRFGKPLARSGWRTVEHGFSMEAATPLPAGATLSDQGKAESAHTSSSSSTPEGSQAVGAQHLSSSLLKLAEAHRDGQLSSGCTEDDCETCKLLRETATALSLDESTAWMKKELDAAALSMRERSQVDDVLGALADCWRDRREGEARAILYRFQEEIQREATALSPQPTSETRQCEHRNDYGQRCIHRVGHADRHACYGYQDPAFVKTIREGEAAALDASPPSDWDEFAVGAFNEGFAAGRGTEFKNLQDAWQWSHVRGQLEHLTADVQDFDSRFSQEGSVPRSASPPSSPPFNSDGAS